jgi:hypothetical protein
MREKAVGYAVMGLGVGLLSFAFYLAYSAFTDPSTLAGFRALAPSKETEPLIYVIPIGLLWVMGSIAGRIAKHGIELVRAVRAAKEKD